jgi:hypothetical protein
MPTLANAIGFNVEASLNAWLRTQLGTYTLPSWLSTLPTIQETFPINTATMPCFSFWHMPVADQDVYLGRQIDATTRGKRAVAMMEVSCWATQTNPNYLAQLRTMADLVRSITTAVDSVLVYDYSTPTAPVVTDRRIILMDTTDSTPQQDTDNPSIWRRRLLLDYVYTLRSNV